ncbi:MAG: molybdopterin-dependent oxidoreductase [Coriobacteriales bacterium]|jgi:thiosulfate reductase/polysulfide reductase chain A
MSADSEPREPLADPLGRRGRDGRRGTSEDAGGGAGPERTSRAADVGAAPEDGAPQPAPRAAWDRDVVTTCGGCSADCGFFAHVGDDGAIEPTLPVPGHPSGAVRLCGRGRRRLALPTLERDRVTHPLRRRPDGSFEPIGWDEAYEEIARRLRAIIDEHGPSSLGLTTGVPSYHWRYAQRLLWALGSPNIYTADAACQASRVTAWQHTLGYSPETDLANTDCVVYFGRSPMDAASASIADEVRGIHRRGARVVVVDPRRNSTVDYADLWLRVRPGHDLAVLLGIAHVLIEEDLYDHEFVARHTTGFDEFARAMSPYDVRWAAREADVDADDILRVARWLGGARPRAVVDCGFHGGLGVAYVNSTQTTRMIALVDALLGSFGKPGGALNPASTIRLGTLEEWSRTPEAGGRSFPAPAEPTVPKVGADRYPLADSREGLCTTIGESIEMGELHALVAYASNPATGYGNARDWMRMLSDLDLLVDIDIRMSETAQISDYVLPEVSYLEADRGVGALGDTLYYRNRVLDLIHPDTRPADRIFRELAGALGVGEYFDFTAEDLARAQIAPYGVDLGELRERGFAKTGVSLGERTGEPVIETPDGKIAFASDVWERAGLGRTPAWQPPLVEPGRDEFRLIGGNNPFVSHTSSQVLVEGGSGGAGVKAGHADAAGAPAGPRDATDGRSHGPRGVSRPRAKGRRASDDHMGAVWMHSTRASQLGVEEGDIVEVSSELGVDRAIAHVTDDLHPSALFTTASPGARSGKHARSREAVEGALGVGPLDHTPLRLDPLSGAALTQENVVRVRRVCAAKGDAVPVDAVSGASGDAGGVPAGQRSADRPQADRSGNAS